MKFFHDKLQSARKMSGLSLEALNKKLDIEVTRQSLHKYETGQMNPDSKVVSALCKALNVRPDYFYKEQTVTIGDLSFRKLEMCTKKEQDMVTERTLDFLERYLELENLLGVSSEKFRYKHTIKVNSTHDIDEEVTKFRKKLNLGLDALYNVIELLEDKGVKVLMIEADDSFDGLSTWVDKSIPVIVLNTNNRSTDRIRFTALHELGHLVLDIEKLPIKDQEQFCHYFAAAMLMPKETVYSELGESRSKINFKELGLIKQQYGMSIQSLLYRAKNLDIISQNTFKSYFIMLNKLGWKKVEPYPFEGIEKSNRFDQLVLRAVSEEVITSSKAVALKNMKLAAFRRYLSTSNPA